MNSRLELATVPMRGTIRDALEALNRGALNVALFRATDGRLEGVVTDGDLRRALLGGAGMESAVEPFVNRTFLRAHDTDDRAAILDLMKATGLSQIPVLDMEERLVSLHLLREIVQEDVRENWAVIMAGGRGVRLRPLTETVPKPMLCVAGRPILERLVLLLVGHGFRRIFLAVNYLADVIEGYFGDGGEYGCEIRYLREERPLGTGGALSLLPERPKHSVVVANGDLVTSMNVSHLVRAHEDWGAAMTISVKNYAHEVPFGVLDVREGLVSGYREKPTQSWPVNAGFYVVRPDILALIPPGVEYHLPTLMEECLRRGEPVRAFPLEEDWVDVGRPPDLERARLGSESRP